MPILLQNSPSLQKTIIDLLAKNHSATANWLQIKATKEYRSCSIQAVYKELRNLQANGVVVKIKQEYSLSYSWIINSIGWIEEIYQKQITKSALANLLPNGINKQTWHFNDLRRLDDLWIQILLTLFEATGEKIAYCWVPHPWFELVHHKQDQAFQRALKRAGNYQYFIIGGDSYLDRHFAKNWSEQVYRYFLVSSSKMPNRSMYINVIGNYIFSFKIDPYTASTIDNLFNNVTANSEIDLAKVVDIFDRGAKVKATLELLPQKSNRLISVFKNQTEGKTL